MTNEEAIKMLKSKMDGHTDTSYEWTETVRMAIKALEQEPCEDTISRQAVLDQTYLWSKDEFLRVTNPFDYLRKRINSLPLVTPKQKTGRWLPREDMDYLDENKVVHHHFMCQDCGFIHDFVDGHTTQYKHCPSCGVKMDWTESEDYEAVQNSTTLPKEHGRLIDADELLKAIDTWDKFGYTAERNLIRLNQDNKDMYVAYIHFDDSVNCIKNMPTIIPVDKEEK